MSRRLVIGLAAVLSVLVAAGAWAAFAPIGHHDLESTVKRISAPGAADPLRVDRWGTRFCWIPFSSCASSDLLYDSGGLAAEQYRQQWEAALAAGGWTRHAVGAEGVFPAQIWWTRGNVAVTLGTESDKSFGPLFDWATGELVVTVERVGNGQGEWPGEHSSGS